MSSDLAVCWARLSAAVAIWRAKPRDTGFGRDVGADAIDGDTIGAQGSSGSKERTLTPTNTAEAIAKRAPKNRPHVHDAKHHLPGQKMHASLTHASSTTLSDGLATAKPFANVSLRLCALRLLCAG